jgi:hypothetical protein
MDADRTGLATWEYKIYELLDELPAERGGD